MLLKRDDIKPNKRDNTSQRPPARAPRNGNSGVVENLYSKGVMSPTTSQEYKRYSLQAYVVWGLVGGGGLAGSRRGGIFGSRDGLEREASVYCIQLQSFVDLQIDNKP